MSTPRVDLSFLVPRFLARLDERLRRIDVALEIIDSLTGEPVEDLMREFHSMAGIGGTYGFPEVTSLAREGEGLLGQVLFEKRSLLPSEIESVRQLVAQLDWIRTSGHSGTTSRAPESDTRSEIAERPSRDR